MVKKFKIEGRYINHFVTKSGKEIGHFFAKEGKQVGHTLMVAGKKTEHISRDVYEAVREEVEKVLKNIDYDAVLHKLVSLIDSTITEQGCIQLCEQVVVTVGGPALNPVVQAASPVFSKICSAALHLIKMEAEEGMKNVHINKHIHKL